MGGTAWYMLTAGKWEGTPWLDLCPQNLLTVLGQAGKQGGAELPLLAAARRNCWCAFSHLLLLTASALYQLPPLDRNLKAQGRERHSSSHPVTSPQQPEHFPFPRHHPSLTQTLKAFCNWALVYQKIHFHFWETGKQGSVKSGKGTWNIYAFSTCENFWNFKPEKLRYKCSFWVN